MEARKILAQYKCAATSTYEAAYTVSSSPVSIEAVISSILICNIGTTSETFRLSVVEDGVPFPVQDKTHIYYDVLIEPNDTFAATLGITLSEDDIIYLYVSSTNLVMSIFGVEIS